MTNGFDSSILAAQSRNHPNPGTIDILVQRQLDDISSGNGAYLETFLRNAKKGGLSTRVIFAPWHSFGNRPFASVHPRIAPLIDEVVWPRAVKIGKNYWSLSPRVWSRLPARILREVARKLGQTVKIDSYLGKPLGTTENRIVASVCNSDIRSITIAEYSSMGPALNFIDQPTIAGVLMHDLLSDRGVRFRASGREPDFVEISREQEAEWVSAANLMIYASANELEVFQKCASAEHAVWLRPEPPEYGKTKTNDAVKIVFLGTVHAGNEDAINHFIDGIWDRVRDSLPEIELHIVGSIGKTITVERASKSGVRVLGRVDDLEDIGGSNSIGIAPTRLATGISIKVVEYLMLDMPSVVYPLALEGFGPRLDELVKSASTPDEYVDAIVDLATNDDKRASISRHLRNRTAETLSNNEVVKCLKAASGIERHRHDNTAANDSTAQNVDDSAA